jgi:hypothetical protein
MDITGKIVTLIAGKLKLMSQTVILMIFTRPTFQQDCPEYLPLDPKCTSLMQGPVSIEKHG